MHVQLENGSLKTILCLAGAASVGFSLATPALADETSIMNDYTPPNTQTFEPVYRIIDSDSVLCMNSPNPECGYEVPDETVGAFPARYGVTDDMRMPGSAYCANNVNPLCENPLNFGREYTPDSSYMALKGRVASVFDELGQSRPSTATVPPRTQPTFTPAPASTAAPAPIQGLW